MAQTPSIQSSAIILFGHGSRSDDAKREFIQLRDRLRLRMPKRMVEHCFLEFCLPTLDQTFKSLLDQGHVSFTIVPMMLFAAGHAKNDIPSEINQVMKQHPEVSIRTASDFGIQPTLINASVDRITQAEAQHASKNYSRDKTLLLVVGRGTSDPDANSDVFKLARFLCESMGFATTRVCYSGVTNPLVAPGVEDAAQSGFKDVMVFPYFLFSGILIDRIYASVDEIQKRYPEVGFIKSGYLNDHPLLIEQILTQISEAENGNANMNCTLCVYREKISGFEHMHGQIQAGHHHHVRAGGHHHHEHSDHAHETMRLHTSGHK